MKKSSLAIFFILICYGVVQAHDSACRVVIRDMYAGDSQEAQNELVSLLKGKELEKLAGLLSSGRVTLFEAGEKVRIKETSVWGYDKVSRGGETKTWLLAPQNSRPCERDD